VSALLPASTVNRKKMAVPCPWAYWLAGPSLDRLRDLLLEPRTVQRNLFLPQTVKRLFAEHTAGKRDHGNRIWRLINLELWFRVCIERQPTEALVSATVAAH